jgi:hypothetical protein
MVGNRSHSTRKITGNAPFIRARHQPADHHNSLDSSGLRQLEISSQGAQLLPVGSAVFCCAKKRLTATRQAGWFAKVDGLMMIRRGE